MDFLDPRHRKSHQVRLIIGYALVSIAVILGTIILVYSAYGYGINTKTGDIVQNGLILTDSQPSGAGVFLNGQYQRATTASRLVESSGDYTLSLSKTGYIEWKRSFSLNEHSIARFTYPILFPQKPQITSVKTYASQPPLVTQSPDQHWLLVEPPGTLSFDEYDVTDLTKPPLVLDLPSDLVATSAGSLSVVEWSKDGDFLILKHQYDGGDEFIVLSRAKPADSYNLNKLIKLDPTEVAMQNHKVGTIYVYSQPAGTVQTADTSSGQLAAPILHGVLAFTPYGSNQLAYITDNGNGKVQARLWSGGKTYPIYTFATGATYLLAAGQYKGATYIAVGSNTEERVNIYKNPLNDITNPTIGRALPLFGLRQAGGDKLLFSENSQMVSVEAGQKLAVYDLQTNTPYRYDLSQPLDGSMRWLDEFHLIGSSNGSIFVMDYDSTNPIISLSATSLQDGGYISKDSKHMLTLRSSTGGTELVNIDMRAGADLPKTTQ